MKRSVSIPVHRLADRLLLLLTIVAVLIFIAYPVVSVVTTSLFDRAGFTLRFYEQLLTKDSIRLIQNSLFVTSLSSGLTLLISLAVALFAFTRTEAGKNRIRKFLTLTLISPPFVSSLAFIVLFGRRGFITYRLLGLSMNPYGWQGIVALQTVGSISFASILLLSALEQIDSKLIQASRDLGADMGRTLRSVLIPQIMPTILSVIFLLFTMNLSDFGTPIVIGGNFRVLATEAYLQILSSPDLGTAAAISMLMIPPAIIAFLLYRHAMRGQTNMAEGSKTQRFHDETYRFPLRIRLVLATAFGLFVLVMLLKYANILLSAVANTSGGQIRWTWHNWLNLPKTFPDSFANSLIFSVAAALISTFFGVLISYYTHRRKLRGMAWIEFIASLPFVIPGTFFGLGYVAAFSKPPIHISGTALIVIANLAFRQISVANKSANAALSNIDPKIDLAAKDLGASDVRILFGILLPTLKQTLLTGFITIFTASMTAVGAIAFLISPGNNVAAVELFRSIENGQYGVGSVQAVIIIVVATSINLFTMWRLGRKPGAHLNSRS